MKFKAYYIKDKKGRALKYMGGSHFWSMIESIEYALDTDRFETKEEAQKFINERSIHEAYSIGEIIIKIK